MSARRMVVLGLIAMCVSAPAWALEIGDDAPPLMIKKWIKGDKFRLKDVKNREIVVVEFWATWCGPCRMSIPHLTEMQAKYKDKRVRFVGISTEDSSTVMNFVHGMGKKMDYTVACDNEHKTYDSLMGPFNQNGIPHAFIIDRKGKLAWHGHPMDEDFGDELELLVMKQPAPVDKKLKEAKHLQHEYYNLAKKKDASKEELDRIGNEMIKLGSDRKEFLVDVTNMIVKSRKIKTRDLSMAKKAVEAACELTDNKDCKVIELRARVAYEMGDMKGAMKYLHDALSVCEDFDHEDKLSARIDALRKKMGEGS